MLYFRNIYGYLKRILLVVFVIYLVYRCILVITVYYFDRTLPVTERITAVQQQARVQEATIQMKQSNSKITLRANQTAHLFGLKKINSASKLDLSKFNTIIEINLTERFIRVGGKANLLSTLETLNHLGYSLKVVPDMDHLTIGGLYSGIGGGATTFKHGAFYCTVKQIEVLTGKGEVILANETQNDDLFKLMPCSLGSLGYVLSFWLEIQPIEKYVYSETHHYSSFSEYLEAIHQTVPSDIDFLDGTIFSPTEFVLITGKSTGVYRKDTPLYGTSLDIPYYVRVRKGYRGYFHYHDYVYRWDIDGYYSMYEDSPAFRLFRQRWFRQAFFHHKLMRGTRLRSIFKPLLTGFTDQQVKADVGDFMLPRHRALEFYEWYEQNIALYPLYICPITFTRQSPFLQCDKDALDFGVGYGVTQNKVSSKTLLRSCMEQTYKLHGDMLKYVSIYRDSEEFWSYYPPSLKIDYERCRQRHDPSRRFYSISEKLTD